MGGHCFLLEKLKRVVLPGFDGQSHRFIRAEAGGLGEKGREIDQGCRGCAIGGQESMILARWNDEAADIVWDLFRRER